MKPVASDPLDAEILAQLQSSDPYDQYFAMMSIWDMDRPGLLPAVLPLLQSSYTDLRYLAVQIIGNVGFSSRDVYGPFLMPLLESKDAELRQYAAESLGELDYQEAIPAIERMLRRETDDESMLFAGRALRFLRGEARDEDYAPEPAMLFLDPERREMPEFECLTVN